MFLYTASEDEIAELIDYSQTQNEHYDIDLGVLVCRDSLDYHQSQLIVFDIQNNRPGFVSTDFAFIDLPGFAEAFHEKAKLVGAMLRQDLSNLPLSDEAIIWLIDRQAEMESAS